MSTSETDSDSDSSVLAADTISSLTAFAHLSATRQPGPTGQPTVSQAVDTLATLDFRLVRRDTALHGLIQNCASTILDLFNTLLQLGPTCDSSCGFIPDIASILRPSFLHLLFQYRRLFRVIATRDFKSEATPLATVCWVDVILANLGDVVALIATGFDGDHPDRSVPGFLIVQREEDVLRAAIQLPDNWDMLPSMLLSERASAAAKRLSIRLMFGRYVLCPALSGQVDMDNTTHQLLSTFAEFVRQSVAQVDGLYSAPGPGLRHLLQQERLTGAMAISLFAAADTAYDSTINAVAFRPQTIAAAMQLLRFVLGGHTTQMNVLNPPDHLDSPKSVVLRWRIVPQWTWSVWLEYSSLYADTIMCLTTAYIRHHNAEAEPLLEASDLISTGSRPTNQAAVISVMINLVSQFISVLSTGAQLSTGMVNVLHGSCQLISQWMSPNSCGIQRSEECGKALITLFGYVSQNEQHSTLNELLIECLTLMRGQCIREAWKAAVEDTNVCFLEALGQSLLQTKMALSQEDLPQSRETCAAQLMQFFVVIMSKGVQPLNLDVLVDIIVAVGERVLEMRMNDQEFLCETLLICLATARLSEIDLPFNKTSVVADEEVMWHLGMCGRGVNLSLASALSLYITSAPVNVESLTFLEGLEHLLDVVLSICSRHYPREDEPLALVVLPTVWNGVAHLLEHTNDTASRVYTCTNTRISALSNVLRSLGNGEDEDPMRDEYYALLRRRLSPTARRVLAEGQMGDRREEGNTEGYELVFCRPRLLYM